MDIPAISVQMQQFNITQAVQIGLLSKASDESKQAGQDLIQMMEQSVQPHIGGNVDLKV